jgi:hypothetical protein
MLQEVVSSGTPQGTLFPPYSYHLPVIAHFTRSLSVQMYSYSSLSIAAATRPMVSKSGLVNTMYLHIPYPCHETSSFNVNLSLSKYHSSQISFVTNKESLSRATSVQLQYQSSCRV